tara:strand:+ start:1271 stop:1570 length:300 start_codon:yes stop_codon:yes gene_type:complete
MAERVDHAEQAQLWIENAVTVQASRDAGCEVLAAAYAGIAQAHAMLALGEQMHALGEQIRAANLLEIADGRGAVTPRTVGDAIRIAGQVADIVGIKVNA